MRWITEVLAVALVVPAVAFAVGCRSATAPRPDVRIAGSDTMLPLSRRLAETFMGSHPGIAIRVVGGSTSCGVEALLSGRAELCAASRPLRADEVQRLYDGFGTMGLRFLVARDALVVLVHPENPVRELTINQLEGIFRGRLTDWSEVGGDAGTIEVVVRSPSSGTHQFFKDHVLNGGDYAIDALTTARFVNMVETIRSRPRAIGYGGMVHGSDVRHLEIGGIEPSPDTVSRDAYPLARYLYFYATEPPTGPTKQFLDWCVGRDGQRVVQETGFIPLWVDD